MFPFFSLIKKFLQLIFFSTCIRKKKSSSSPLCIINFSIQKKSSHSSEKKKNITIKKNYFPSFDWKKNPSSNLFRIKKKNRQSQNFSRINSSIIVNIQTSFMAIIELYGGIKNLIHLLLLFLECILIQNDVEKKILYYFFFVISLRVAFFFFLFSLSRTASFFFFKMPIFTKVFLIRIHLFSDSFICNCDKNT